MNTLFDSGAPLLPWANLVVSVGMALLGLFLYTKRRPPLFDSHRFMTWAFWFLFSRWILLAAVYVVVIFFGEHPAVLMAVLDLQSVCDLGFAWSFIQGDELNPRRTWKPLAILWGVLLLWNLVFRVPGHVADASTFVARAKWTSASEALSVFCVPLLGFSFLLRYRIVEALVLFILSLVYTVLQQPIYISTLIHSGTMTQGVTEVPAYLFALGFGKLVLGGMTYGFFFARVDKYSVVTSDLSPQTIAAIRKATRNSAKWIINTAIVLLAAIAADLFVRKYHLFERVFGGH